MLDTSKIKIRNSLDADGKPAGGSASVDVRMEGGHDGRPYDQRVLTVDFQDGPILESKGRNGAFVDDLLYIAKARIEFYNRAGFACDENHLAINAKQLAESIEGAVMPDVASYYTKIAGTEAENAKVRANAALEKARAAAKDRADESNKLTAELAALDQKKAEMIRGATMPVEGLSLTEDGVVYRGVPFAQASSAEQLRVSVAMGIAMNPTLKVLLIHDGSLLDDESLADVASMAAAADAQVWIERVGHGEECSVVIEDGSVEAEGGAE